MRPGRAILGLLVAATLLGGSLAGGNVDRGVVQNAAWRRLGPLAWAAYSRHADLSPRGFALYPFLAIGGALAGVAAAILAGRSRVPRRAVLPVYAAALLALAGLLATTQAAPIMLSVRGLGEDAAALRQAMAGFMFWGGVRGVFQVSAFLADVWALAAFASTQAAPPS